MHVSKKILIGALLFFSFLSSETHAVTKTSLPKNKPAWQVETDLGIGRNFLGAALMDDDAIYLSGDDLMTEGRLYASGNTHSRLEKRNKSDGSLALDFGRNGDVSVNVPGGLEFETGIHAFAADQSHLYLLGYAFTNQLTGNHDGETAWLVQKRDKKTGNVSKDFADSGQLLIDFELEEAGKPTDLKINGNNIYLAGQGESPGGRIQNGRIQKRDITTGDLIFEIKTQVIHPRIHVDEHFIYLLGAADFPEIHWTDHGAPLLFEKRSKTNGALIWSVPYKDYYMHGPRLTGDRDSLYLAFNKDWQGFIEKRDKNTGKLVKKTAARKKFVIDDIIIDQQSLYTAGDVQTELSPKNFFWLIEKRDFKRLGLLKTLKFPAKSFSKSVANPDQIIRFLAADTGSVYTAGYVQWESAPGAYGNPTPVRGNWIIKKNPK